MTTRAEKIAEAQRLRGETREALLGGDGKTWVTGDLLAVQGKEGCRDVRCTRRNGRCVDWHCPYCGESCSSQGHGCKRQEAEAG